MILPFFAQMSPSIDKTEWDLLMVIEEKYKVGLEISDADFMLNLTSKNHSFKLPAQALFPNRIMPEKLFIYFKLQPKVKTFTLLTIRDPDQRIRFQIRGFERRGQVSEYRINVTIDPIINSIENLNKEFTKTVEFTVPFLYSPWTVGILFETRKITFYTSCDDIEKPLGYHLVMNTVPIDMEMFRSGATIHIFNDGNIGKYKDHFVGTVAEFTITNQTKLKEFMCKEDNVQGSGTKMKFWKLKYLGNVLLTQSTSSLSTTLSPTTIKSTQSSSTTKQITSPSPSTSQSTATSLPTFSSTLHRSEETKIISPSSTNILSTANTDKSTKSTTSMKFSQVTYDSNNSTKTISNPISKKEHKKNPSETSESDCPCLKLLRLSKPEKGAKGTKGNRGDKGSMGPSGAAGLNGTCPTSTCSSLLSKKGEKGNLGSPGYCSVDLCQQGIKNGPKGEKGDSGTSGQRGDKGDKQTSSDIISSIIPVIKKKVEDLVKNNLKSLKGEPGSCKCDSDKGSDNKKPQINTMVLNDAIELRSLSSSMAIGQIVFLVVENILLIKVDEVKNRWRIVKLDDTQSDWYLSVETSNIMASQQVAPNSNTKNIDIKIPTNTELKLMLIALPQPRSGDLRSVMHEPGAYSGSSYQCQKHAYSFNLGRAFYPLINTDTFDFSYMVPEKYRFNVPIVNINNEKIAQSFEDLLKLTNPITSAIMDFLGHSIMTSIKPPCIWIGKKPTLYEFKLPTEEGLCVNWMSRQTNSTGVTTKLITGKALLDPSLVEETLCHKSCYVLCMQIYPSVDEINKRQ